MQLLFDFFPVIAFFVAYKLAGIYVATGVIIVAVVVQVAVQWFRHQKISTMALVSAALVLVFGGLTLLVHDKTFIQWKPTVVNWLFAVAFLASHFIGSQTIVQRMLGSQITLPAASWRRLNLGWVVFFILMGAANLYVAYRFDESTWVNFKLFGVLGLTILFVLLQGAWIAGKAQPAQSPAPDSRSAP